MYNGMPPAGEAAGQDGSVGRPAVRPRGFSSRPWYVRALLLGPVYLVALATILLSIQLIRYTIRFPEPRALTVAEPGPRVRVLARDGSVIAERGDSNDFIPLDRLPRHLVDAVVAIEDRRFFSHWGVDPAGLVRAALANLRAGRTAQGGSTLTQQLAKNLFLSTERTLSRKLEEVVFAFWLEIRLSKREILELYLNRVYFGGGAYGVEAAAQRYFGKSARSVSVAEAAVIAGLLKAPSKYSPFTNPGYARARARVVIEAMESAHLISPISADAAVRQSVHFASSSTGKHAAGLEYAVDYVLDRIPPLASVSKRLVIVETTIDPDVQRRAQSAITDTLARSRQAARVGQAAFVLMDTGGGIRALVGGRSFAESQFNRAVKARRQPGSAFKPFVYLAALESGMRPDTPVVDAPIEIGNWSPRNDDGRYRGPVTLTQALAHSVNTVAVRLQQQIGGEKIAGVARRLGILSPLRPDASMALGTSEVSLLELCGAYGALASGGTAVHPHVIRRVRTSDGDVLYQRAEPQPHTVVSPDTLGSINAMLNAAVVSGTGRRAAFPRHQAAGKTGTTQDFRDAWFVGYTAHLVAGVWFGNDDGTPMNHVTGGSLPASVWHDVMMAAHASLIPRALPAVDDGAIEPARVPPLVARGPASALPRRASAVVLAAGIGGAHPSTPSAAPPAARTPVSTPRSIVRKAVRRSPPPASVRHVPPRKPAAARRPAGSIDPELFARALAIDPAPAKQPVASATRRAAHGGTSFDPGRIRDVLRETDRKDPARMGLGLRPAS